MTYRQICTIADCCTYSISVTGQIKHSLDMPVIWKLLTDCAGSLGTLRGNSLTDNWGTVKRIYQFPSCIMQSKNGVHTARATMSVCDVCTE